jgi:hypothetical protein
VLELQTAALAFGGYTTTQTAATEEYDGSTWTTVASLATARAGPCRSRNYKQLALAFGGSTPSNTAATEEWNGVGSSINKNNNGKLIWQNI